MSDFEERLKQAPLAEPSPAMDTAIERYFREAAARPPRLWERRVSLWQCAVACLLCCVAGFFASGLVRDPGPAPVQVTERIYYLPSQEAGYRNAFEAPAAGGSSLPFTPGPFPEAMTGPQGTTRKDGRT